MQCDALPPTHTHTCTHTHTYVSVPGCFVFACACFSCTLRWFDPHARALSSNLLLFCNARSHAGRLVFAGHAGQIDVVWFSDDSGRTWTLSNSTFGSNNATKGAPDGTYGCGRPHGCFDEPFPVQLPGGVVQLNMRNDSLTCDPKNCCCASLPITHPRTVADSTDGGLTFGAHYQIESLPEPTQGCQASSLVVQVGAAGHEAVLFSNPSSGNMSRLDLTVRRSDDGGAT